MPNSGDHAGLTRVWLRALHGVVDTLGSVQRYQWLDCQRVAATISDVPKHTMNRGSTGRRKKGDGGWR